MQWRPGPAASLNIACSGIVLICLAAIVAMPSWQLVPCTAIWTLLAVRCTACPCSPGRALRLAAAATLATTAAIGWDVARGAAPREALAEGFLLAVMFVAALWTQIRGYSADQSRADTTQERLAVRQARQATAQRQFMEDASHQLRAPIAIALGHAELLAAQLAGQQGRRDIDMVVGELGRLRTLSERLLLVATSENPESLRTEPVELDMLAADRLLCWQPTAERRWSLGPLDPVLAMADAERLRLALDALLENAVQHTASGDVITISVTSDTASGQALISVEDTGEGIKPEDLPHIFDRFAGTGTGGTGLGLTLVRAIARGHQGEARVRSTPGEGSRFDLQLPAWTGGAAGGQPAGSLGHV